MSKYVKALATLLLIPVLKLYRESAIKLLKIKAEALYTNSVRSLHYLYVVVIVVICSLIVMTIGFMMLNILIILSIFILFSKKVAMIIFILLAMTYFLVPLYLIRRSCLNETWAQFMDANRMMEKLSSFRD